MARVQRNNNNRAAKPFTTYYTTPSSRFRLCYPRYYLPRVFIRHGLPDFEIEKNGGTASRAVILIKNPVFHSFVSFFSRVIRGKTELMTREVKVVLHAFLS